MIYDYLCVQCGQFSRTVPVSKRDHVRCTCGKKPTRLLAKAQILVPLRFHTNKEDIEPDE